MNRIRPRNGSSIKTDEHPRSKSNTRPKLLQGETDLAREGLLRKCVRNSIRLHVALQKSTPSNARRRRHAFGNQKPDYGSLPAVQWPIDRVVNGPISISDLEFSELFCRAQRRTEIAEFVIDLVRSFDGLSNFFAEQRAIAFA